MRVGLVGPVCQLAKNPPCEGFWRVSASDCSQHTGHTDYVKTRCFTQIGGNITSALNSLVNLMQARIGQPA
jgi:hypothetical protein